MTTIVAVGADTLAASTLAPYSKYPARGHGGRESWEWENN